MTIDPRVHKLADLIRRKNEIDAEIAEIVGRPALMGHVGEFLASQIFAIELARSANAKDLDGYFNDGPLKGKSVNVKWYGKGEGLLDLRTDARVDYYLVMTGPPSPAGPSRGAVRPWLIHHVFLFETGALLSALGVSGVKVGIATSVRSDLWEAAEVYPAQGNGTLPLCDEQRQALKMFFDPLPL